MFRFSSLLAGAALCTGVSTASAATPNPADTILVKLSDGSSMTLYLKNPEEMRRLRTYKMDSLMALLDRYVTQAQAVSKAAGDAGRTTMEFYPSRDLQNPNAPEKVQVVVYGDKARRTQTTSTVVKLGRNVQVNVQVDGAGREKTSICINDEDSLSEVRHQRYDEAHTHTWLNLGFGLNALVNAKTAQSVEGGLVPLDLRPWGSRYVHLGILNDTRLGRAVRSPAFVRYGFQFAFNNYMLDKNRAWVDQNDTTLLTTIPTEQRTLRKSKLTTSVLQIPVLLGLRFRNRKGNESVVVAAGGFAGYRLGAHTKLKYEQDGDIRKPKEHGSFNLEDFQYGFTGSVSIFGHEIFATYNLNELFRKDRGPKANVVAVGLTLMDFDGDLRSRKYRNN